MKINKHLQKDGLMEIAKMALTMTKNPRRIKSLEAIITSLKV